eukprot:scaffold21162_cov65-Attheya_sp.AAC.3
MRTTDGDGGDDSGNDECMMSVIPEGGSSECERFTGPSGINCWSRRIRDGLVGHDMLRWKVAAGDDTAGGKESFLVGNCDDFEHSQC